MFLILMGLISLLYFIKACDHVWASLPEVVSDCSLNPSWYLALGCTVGTYWFKLVLGIFLMLWKDFLRFLKFPFDNCKTKMEMNRGEKLVWGKGGVVCGTQTPRDVLTVIYRLLHTYILIYVPESGW